MQPASEIKPVAPVSLDDFTHKMLEIPYKHRGRSWEGADCYGAIIIFYREFLNITLLDVIKDYDERWEFKNNKNYFLENYHKQFEKVEKPKPFDIILFQRVITEPSGDKRVIANHGGIVLKNGKFIHMSREGISINHYSHEKFIKRFNGFYRYKNAQD